jgi:hypothetical protein
MKESFRTSVMNFVYHSIYRSVWNSVLNSVSYSARNFVENSVSKILYSVGNYMNFVSSFIAEGNE